jgi:hypothetical protein|tara:strand:- start:70 stop:594 length:525 start_codon:yes stop_codon:yes gene_type:complete
MKLGNFKNLIFFFAIVFPLSLNAADKIETIPLVNLEKLSPTFEEDKDELEKLEKDNINLDNDEEISNIINKKKSSKIYINLKTLDKITAKTSDIRLAIGEKSILGPLEIKALKCQFSEDSGIKDIVAYLQVKDLSTKDNDQVFLFNGWTFTSSPTLQSIDHPVYDLWVIDCENI